MGNIGPEMTNSHLYAPYAQQQHPQNYPNFGNNSRNQSPHGPRKQSPHIYNPYGSMQNPYNKPRQDYSQDKINRTNPPQFSFGNYAQQSPKNNNNITLPNSPQIPMNPRNHGFLPPTIPNPKNRPANNIILQNEPIKRPQSHQKPNKAIDDI